MLELPKSPPFNFFGTVTLSKISLHFSNKYEGLVLLVCDEMSMVRSDLFHQFHERLQQVKQTDRIFGVVAVLLFGNLLQLKPVRGHFKFQQPRAQKYSGYYYFCNLWMHFCSVVLHANHRLISMVSLG